MLSQSLTATGSLTRFIEILACNLPASQIWSMAAEATASTPTSDESQSLMEAVGTIILDPARDDRMARPLTRSEELELERWLDELAAEPF